MTRFVQRSAEDDILEQVAWYADQGLADVARRFYAAVLGGISDLLATPEAGTLKSTSNPRLVGMRAWPVKGFDAFRIYYLVSPGQVLVVRVLHGRRDLGAIFDQQDVEGRTGML